MTVKVVRLLLLQSRINSILFFCFIILGLSCRTINYKKHSLINIAFKKRYDLTGLNINDTVVVLSHLYNNILKQSEFTLHDFQEDSCAIKSVFCDYSKGDNYIIVNDSGIYLHHLIDDQEHQLKRYCSELVVDFMKVDKLKDTTYLTCFNKNYIQKYKQPLVRDSIIRLNEEKLFRVVYYETIEKDSTNFNSSNLSSQYESIKANPFSVNYFNSRGLVVKSHTYYNAFPLPNGYSYIYKSYFTYKKNRP